MFVPGQNQLLANLSLLLFLRIFRSFVFMILKRTFEECVSLFSYQRSVLHRRLSQTALLLYHVVSCLSRTFFNFFEVVFVSLLQQLWYLITSDQLLSRTFLFLFDSFVISVRSLRRNSDRIPLLARFVNNFLNFSYNLFIRVIYHISDSYSYRRNRPAGRFPYFLPVCFFYTIYNTVY